MNGPYWKCVLDESYSSIRFCRPVKPEFVKKIKDHILAEKKKLDNQIKDFNFS